MGLVWKSISSAQLGSLRAWKQPLVLQVTLIPELSSGSPVHCERQGGRAPRRGRQGGCQHPWENVCEGLGLMGGVEWGARGCWWPQHPGAGWQGVMAAPLPPSGHFLWLQGMVSSTGA